MKTIKQVFRQPMRTLAGILLIAMAVSILITCVGQYAAASVTRAELDRQYDTVALTTDASLSLHWPASGEYYYWHENLIQDQMLGDRSDIIKTISETGLLSAYIPDMNPDNFTQHYEVSGSYASAVRGAPYNCAVLVITLDEIGAEITEIKKSGSSSEGVYAEIDQYATMTCRGTVEQVIALQEDFNNPEGWSVHLTIIAKNKASLEEMELKIGQRYLVYSMEYFDNDWFFRKGIAVDAYNFSKPFDMDKVYTEHPDPNYVQIQYDWVWNYYENTVKGKKIYHPFDAGGLVDDLKCCSLTVCDYATLPHIITKLNEEGNFAGFEALADQRVLLEDEHSDMLYQTGTTQISQEEYLQMYSIPTMVELEGNVEDFLNSADGAAWRTVLESTQINNHAFPVLAVDKLGYQAEFAREQARIVQGRDFTQTELENGEKVCIISETLATAHSLKVGDSITMQTYHHDPNITQHVIGWGYPNPRNAYPQATYYSQARGFSSDPERYTIVGLYRQENEQSEYGNYRFSAYGFLSDTLFIPKNSTNAKMVTWDEGLFQSIIIKNGMLDDFNAVLVEFGYEDMFVVYDRGYNEIFSGLTAYEEVAGKALYIGIGAYAVILLLYLLLFPGRQKRTLATMDRLGTPKRRKFSFVFSSSFVILLPGTILGAAISLILREGVAVELMESVGVSIPLVFSSAVTTFAVSAAQLAVAMSAVSIFGMLLVREHGLSRK